MAKQKGNFTKLFEELENIVIKFERGNIDLDEQLAEFEKGLKLVEELRARLKDVGNKVVVLKKKFNTAEAAPTAADAEQRQIHDDL